MRVQHRILALSVGELARVSPMCVMFAVCAGHTAHTTGVVFWQQVLSVAFVSVHMKTHTQQCLCPGAFWHKTR